MWPLGNVGTSWSGEERWEFPKGMKITRERQRAWKSWWWRRNCRNEKERGKSEKLRRKRRKEGKGSVEKEREWDDFEHNTSTSTSRFRVARYFSSLACFCEIVTRMRRMSGWGESAQLPESREYVLLYWITVNRRSIQQRAINFWDNECKCRQMAYAS